MIQLIYALVLGLVVVCLLGMTWRAGNRYGVVLRTLNREADRLEQEADHVLAETAERELRRKKRRHEASRQIAQLRERGPKEIP